MRDQTVKKFNYSIQAVWFILLAVFFVFSESISFRSVDRENSKSIIEALFLTIFGLLLLIMGIVNSIAAWTRTADQYMSLLYFLAIGSWGKRTLGFCSNRYWLWQGRIILLFCFLLGLAFSYAGFANLMRFLPLEVTW
ncbi:MAG: hypothetical protein IT327_26230 [Anaerolineae bacterium]|nr:hypothetical protein [Anaerolineae bacterium]